MLSSPVVELVLTFGLVWLARHWYLDSKRFDELPGPPSDHWLLGNLWFAFSPNQTPGDGYRAACSTYGTTWRDRGLLSRPRLFTSDPRALAHMFKNAYSYPKPGESRRAVEEVTGPGLVVVEGEQHKRQRRVVSSSFAMSEVKHYTSLFFEKGYILRDLIDDMLIPNPDHIDMAKQLARCTLDIIGVAGFDHDLGCMSADAGAQKERDLTSLFAGNFSDLSLLWVLQSNLGFFRCFPTEKMKLNERSLKRLQTIGQDIVTRKKAEILSGKVSDSDKISSGDLENRDLLTRIMRANLADDLPESQRLPDEELVAQITTFLFAGFETTSTALSFTLDLLSTRPEIQDRLRQELRSVVNDHPSLDELNDLPYLDAVVRESLRICPPATVTQREALADDVLPLSVPVKSTKTGEMIQEIPIRKGDVFVVPVHIVNTSEETWGPDAMLFNPDRWLKPLPSSTAELAPFWSHQATFLAGPRACIGFRFALAEMKALLFILLRTFAFAPSVPYSSQIVHRQSLVNKPVKRGSEKDGSTMPLKITRAP